MNIRWISVVTVVAAMLVPVWPAQAGTESGWGDPQTISSRYGRSVTLADDGRTAVWIRTDEVGNHMALGPVMASTYGGADKGWKKPVVVPGTAESSAVSLSDDGRAVLVEADGAGYGIAERSGGRWSAPAPVGSGAVLRGGELSGSGDVVAWVQYVGTGISFPGLLWARTRGDDGTWGDPQRVGTVNNELAARPGLMPVMSRDGSTLIWLDETNALRAAVRGTDGAWSPTGVIKQYDTSSGIFDAMVSASGKRFAWVGAGLITSIRDGLTWSPADNVSLDRSRAIALSPKGSLLAWSTQERDCCRLKVRRWKRGAWLKTEILGDAGRRWNVRANDTTVVWLTGDWDTPVLRTATLTKGNWTVSGKIAKKLRRPALSLDGSTLAWSATDTERIVSVRR